MFTEYCLGNKLTYLVDIIMFLKAESPVYLKDRSGRKEYVENEIGLIYTGTDKDIQVQEWAYNQFLNDTLFYTMKILERACLLAKQYADPIEIVRTLSQIVSFFFPKNTQKV